MSNVLNSILGNNKMNMGNEVIANDMLSGTKAAASAYLVAALESATPELKALYSSSVNEMLKAHSTLTDLCVDKKWYRPYDRPYQQLADVYKQSVSTTTEEE
jgi:spore coat protein CotF